MKVYINGKLTHLSPQKVLGKGGEADIFALDNSLALKVFKQPNHPDHQGIPSAQKAAQQRLEEHQQKLRQFPHNLPENIITPQGLATDRTGQTILGYTMTLINGGIPLLKYSDRRFRSTSGIGNQTIIDLFKQLHQIVAQLHQKQIIIGDFNDLNILVSGEKPYLIDSDSYQFQSFLCRVFTPRFVDPLLCIFDTDKILLNQIYNIYSDWYAFTVMLMQCLLFVEPYGGVYKPKKQEASIVKSQRMMKRITIFHPAVKYPKPAIPYQVLSEDLLQYFYQCFMQDKRATFPIQLLDNLTWYHCQSCGTESNYAACPLCHKKVSKSLSKPLPSITNTLVVTPIFNTKGIILEVVLDQNKLRWLYHENKEFKRETNTTILQGDLDQGLQFWLQNDLTFVGKQGRIITLKSQQVIEAIAVDSYQQQLMFQCNAADCYWLHQGQLLKKGKIAADYIGDVLEKNTQFWLGSHFGFGLYRAGTINIAFVFHLHRTGINDQVKLPRFPGKIIEANCRFSESYCWFFLTLETQGKLVNQVYVINSHGEIVAMTEVNKNDQSWLSNLEGKFAFNHCLLSATDEGIIRLELQKGAIVPTKLFRETEPFVTNNSHLFASSQGIYVVNEQDINFLSYQV